MTVAWLACLGAGRPAAASDADFFETRVRPVLARNCLGCHGDSELAGLRLDSRSGMLKGGRSGPAVIPGNPDESLLIQAVRHVHARLRMPPQGKLPDEAVADLAAWIKAGAAWPETPAAAPAPQAAPSAAYVITPEQRAFWAFQPVREPAAPRVKDHAWPKTPIDAFVLHKLEAEGLRPGKPADRRVWLRRATFDLIGLPPTPEEVDAFVHDRSRAAVAKVVERLLASPHYGERWGRYWLDLARYADGQLGAFTDTPFANAFRYRDWVIQAFNEDLPYDRFVKAQIAADRSNADREQLLPGLGFQALARDANDQVDVTTRVFLGLTAGCAQCHNHKYDPIPTQDYYALVGVFRSSEAERVPLAPAQVVEAYKSRKAQVEKLAGEIDDFVQKQSGELAGILAIKTARYMTAAWEVESGRCPDAAAAARKQGLDREILERWIAYLKPAEREHPFLKPWDEAMARGPAAATPEQVTALAADFQKRVLAVFEEKRGVDDRNYVALGGAAGAKNYSKRQFTNIETMDPQRYYLWRDLASEPYTRSGGVFKFRGGVYYYGNAAPKPESEDPSAAMPRQDIGRFLDGVWREHLDAMRADLDALKRALPAEYPYLHALRDRDKPANARVAIRGDAQNLGEEVPRAFLRILCDGEPRPFTQGSGRLELAEAIASPKNPLTARVMVNRVWQWHFGRGLVSSASNFGQLGERPSHPELLDYLAARFVASGWSIKALHREIMLSAIYGLSSEEVAENKAKDPDNRLLWRANLRLRLDVEALHDAVLAVSGLLDPARGGPAAPFNDAFRRRGVYAYIGRTKPDPTLALFDFPNPTMTAERRTVTVGPLQRLFFLNSPFVTRAAEALSERVRGAPADGDRARIARAYRLLFGRTPTAEETDLGLEFLAAGSRAWPQYAQVLLTSSEFACVN